MAMREPSSAVHPGEVLREDFLLPLGLTAYRLAKAVGMTESAVGEILHGKVSEITHDGRGVFAGLMSPLPATRYHSLAIRADSVPDVLEVSARSEHGIIMGVRHRVWPLQGVQFHPESFLTLEGPRLLRNFIEMNSHACPG